MSAHGNCRKAKLLRSAETRRHKAALEVGGYRRIAGPGEF